jgi:hypothetical protein
MRHAIAFALSVAIVALTPGRAAVEPDKSAAKASGDDDRMVCKTKPQTGTRLRTKTCYTAAEWERIAEENRRAMKDMLGPVIETRRQ